MIKDNGLAKAVEPFWFSLPDAERRVLEVAHRELCYDVLMGTVPDGTGVYELHGAEFAGGIVFNDPAPNPSYAGNLAGSWIWSHEKAFLRFHVIVSRQRVEVWQFGSGPFPLGIGPAPRGAHGGANQQVSGLKQVKHKG